MLKCQIFNLGYFVKNWKKKIRAAKNAIKATTNAQRGRGSLGTRSFFTFF